MLYFTLCVCVCLPLFLTLLFFECTINTHTHMSSDTSNFCSRLRDEMNRSVLLLYWFCSRWVANNYKRQWCIWDILSSLCVCVISCVGLEQVFSPGTRQLSAAQFANQHTLLIMWAWNINRRVDWGHTEHIGILNLLVLVALHEWLL